MNLLKLFLKKTNQDAIGIESGIENVENKEIEKILERKCYLEDEISRLEEVIERSKNERYDDRVEIRTARKKNEALKSQNESLQRELEGYKAFYEHMYSHRSEIKELFDAAETERNRLEQTEH